MAYNSPQSSTQPMTEFPQMDSGLAVPVFNQGDDPIACLNKAMAFLIAVASSRVAVQQVQGRQGQSCAGTSSKGNATSSRGNNAGGQTRVIKCYNCQGKGHMARQCTQPKRPRNGAWFKEKAMLVEAQESGQILDEEKLAFLADPGIPEGQAAQTTILNTAAFQNEDLDAYDSDCDYVFNAKAVLMANLSNYGSDVISKVPHFKPYYTDMDNQSVRAMQGFKQTPVVDFTDNEITSDSNIISYSQYLQETQQAAVQDTNFVASPVIDDEETLILEEVSRSKMLAKQNDPISKEKNVNTTPINYVELNRLSEDFGNGFIPQQELFAEQAFWLQTSRPNIDQSASSLVKIEAPKELPKCFEIHKKEPFLENDRLLHQIMICVINSTSVFDDVNLEMQRSEFCVKCLDLDAKLLNKQNAYNDLSKSYSQLKKHCISLELTMQLNQEIFQKDSFSNNQNALEIPKYFENNDLKAQLQAKDTTICKLKEHIKSMRENGKEEKVKHEMNEIETINIELEHSVAKLLSENERLHKENEHLKKIYKDQFDSIKKTRALYEKHCDSLIA
ncbi:retrovirus-related pol polyprotein from transposon TNT 1-94 [Tanacetum coccineum]